MPDTITDSLIVQSLGWALLQFVWQGAAVGLLTAAVLGLLSRHTAAVRYLIASAGLVVMFLLPVATTFDHLRRASNDSVAAAATEHPASSMAPSPVGGLAPATPARPMVPWHGFTQATRESFGAWSPVAVLVWLAGVVGLSIRLLAGWLVAERFRRRATRPVSEVWSARVQSLSRLLRVTRPVRVLESAVVAVPAVIGWLRPVLLLPTAAMAGLSPSQLEAVITHELAHIRRHDYLVNGLQTAIETLLFYHPAVWWVSARIRQEREHACDDTAIAVCGDPIAYGRALADLDELRRVDGTLVLAATGGSLTERVRRLVNGPVPPLRRSMVGFSLCGVVAACTLAVVVARSAAMPDEVGGLETTEIPAARPDGTGPDSRTITLVDSDDDQGVVNGPMHRYFTTLFDQAGMADADVARVLRQAGDQVPSDYELALLLRQQRRHAQAEPLTKSAYFAATSTIASDHEMRLVLTELVANGPIPGDLLAEVLDTASGIQSDEERTRLLVDVAEMQSLGDGTRERYFALLDEMQSNSERATVLTALVPRVTDTTTLTSMLQSTARLNSDAHKRHVLQTAVRHELAASIREPFFQAAGTIQSDHEKRRTLSGVADLDAPSVDTLAETLRMAAAIDSDYELAFLLVRIADRHRLNGELRHAFLTAANTIGEPYEQRQVLAALARS